MTKESTIADTEDVVAALSRGLYATDAARRVGWARAYDAEAKFADAESAARVYRERYSYLFGFLWGYLDGRGLPREVIDEMIGPVDLIGELMDSGEQRGQQVRQAHNEERHRE